MCDASCAYLGTPGVGQDLILPELPGEKFSEDVAISCIVGAKMLVTGLPVVSRTFVGSLVAYVVLAVALSPCPGLELLDSSGTVVAPCPPGPSKSPNTPPNSRRETGLAAMDVMRANNSKNAGSPPLYFIV